jgi:hypothetical protein
MVDWLLSIIHYIQKSLVLHRKIPPRCYFFQPFILIYGSNTPHSKIRYNLLTIFHSSKTGDTMSEEKKSFLDKAVDALTNRDEKAALAKAQREAEAAKRDAAQMRAQMASKKRTDDAKAAAKAKADKVAAQRKTSARRTTAGKKAVGRGSKRSKMEAMTAKKIGVVTEGLKLRSGPGEEFDPPIGWLKTGDKLEILEELEFWLKVKVEGKEGYVGKKYVKIGK